jgi:hypothetical protein
MTRHDPGNTSDLHDDVQDKLFRILKDMGRRPVMEHLVPSIALGMCKIDVADLTPKQPSVYYEIETEGRTARFRAKEREFHKRLGKDIQLIDLRELKRDVPKLEFLKVMKWLRERVI